jgi:hypothetical protein
LLDASHQVALVTYQHDPGTFAVRVRVFHDDRASADGDTPRIDRIRFAAKSSLVAHCQMPHPITPHFSFED